MKFLPLTGHPLEVEDEKAFEGLIFGVFMVPVVGIGDGVVEFLV